MPPRLWLSPDHLPADELASGPKAPRRAKAVIILLKTVGGKWKLVAAFLNLLPMMVTDKLYDWVAANRYKWFGRRESCFIP